MYLRLRLNNRGFNTLRLNDRVAAAVSGGKALSYLYLDKIGYLRSFFYLHLCGMKTSLGVTIKKCVGMNNVLIERNKYLLMQWANLSQWSSAQRQI